MSILGLEFTVKQTFRNELGDKVWKILSKVEDMPKYWRGHREIVVVGNDGSNYIVKIRFAFPGPNNTGMARILVNDENKRVIINYIKGPIRGYVINYISNNTIISQWNVSINPLFVLMKPWIKRHFMEGANNALLRIVNEAETTT
jgi:hypothetical protein